jgi:hypothetical protein
MMEGVGSGTESARRYFRLRSGQNDFGPDDVEHHKGQGVTYLVRISSFEFVGDDDWITLKLAGNNRTSF